MTRKLILFAVCSFEVALILFVAGWTVHAKTEQLYACSQWVRYNEKVITEEFRANNPDKLIT